MAREKVTLCCSKFNENVSGHTISESDRWEVLIPKRRFVNVNYGSFLEASAQARQRVEGHDLLMKLQPRIVKTMNSMFTITIIGVSTLRPKPR